MSKENKKLIEEIDLTVEQEAPASTGITLQAGLDRTIKTVDTVADRADNNEGDIIELNSGNFDVNGDGSKITKIFDANGDLVTGLNTDMVVEFDDGTTETYKVGK